MDTSMGTTQAISKKLNFFFFIGKSYSNNTVHMTPVRYGVRHGYGAPNEVSVLPNHT